MSSIRPAANIRQLISPFPLGMIRTRKSESNRITFCSLVLLPLISGLGLSGCRPGTTGAPLIVLIMNRVSGAILATLNAGGGDQVWYDPATNRYYNAASRWTDSGKAGVGGACSAAAPCTPVLAVIDAGTRTVFQQAPSGNNAHSVAVDAATHQAYLPFSSSTAPGGCLTCATTFPTGGVLVYKTQ